MATKRIRKRTEVIPFPDEANFVVPKKGGFGQPDNKHYVMVAGDNYAYATAPITLGGTTTNPSPSETTNTQVSTDIGTTTSTISTNQNSGNTQQTVTGATNPRTTIQDPTLTQEVPTTTTTSTTTTSPRPQLGIDVTLETTTSNQPSQAQLDCEANGNIWSNGVCTINTIPNFPNWDSLDCSALDSQISALSNTLATGTFSGRVVDAYNTQLATARTIRAAKCIKKEDTTTPTIILPTTPTTGGGGFGGGGGGGLGESPIEGTPTIEEPKSNKMIFVILGLIGLLYFLSKKSN